MCAQDSVSSTLQRKWLSLAVGVFLSQVSLTGLAALQALLHHSHFYQEVETMLSLYYPQPAIHPVSVAGFHSALTTPVGSQDTALTAASGSFNGTFIGAEAPVRRDLLLLSCLCTVSNKDITTSDTDVRCELSLNFISLAKKKKKKKKKKLKKCASFC